jgi:hypothetical protein
MYLPATLSKQTPTGGGVGLTTGGLNHDPERPTPCDPFSADV